MDDKFFSIYVWHEYWFKVEYRKGNFKIKSILGLPLHYISIKLLIPLDILLEYIETVTLQELEKLELENNYIWNSIEY